MWEKVIMDTLTRRPDKKVDYVVLRSEQVRRLRSLCQKVAKGAHIVGGYCAYPACQVAFGGTNPQRGSRYEESAPNSFHLFE
jgi:hypothetical protein